MKKNDDDSKLVGRRGTLQLFGLGLSAGGFLLLDGCGSKGSGSGADGTATAAAGEGCNTPIDEASKTKRRTLQYLDKAAVPEKNCAACAQFEEGKFGDCGGCKVIPGPVNPKGGCLSFAPKSASSAAPATTG